MFNRALYHGGIAALLLIATTATAHAQWSDDPAVNLPIGDLSSEQVQAKVRVAPDGGAYVSWFDNSGGGYDVRLQRLDRNGVEQWPHNGVLVADRSVSSTEDYGLEVDADGNAILVYGLVNFSSLAVQKVDPNGNLLWGPSGTVITSDQHSPRVAVLNDGHIVVGWSGGSPSKLNFQKLDADGVLQWEAPVVIADPAAPTSRPLLLADIEGSDGGNFIAIWMRCTGSNCVTSNRHLQTQKFDSTGAPLWNDGVAISVFDANSIQNGAFPPILSDGAGGAIYSWYETGGSRLAYVQHIDAGGVELFPHNGVAAMAPVANRANISAAVDYDPSTEEIFLAFTEVTAPTQNMWGVRAQKFSANGERLWADAGIEILPLSTNQNSFTQVAAWAGGCVVSYLDPRVTGSVVQATRLDADGAPVWSPAILDVSTRATGKARLAMALTPCGMAVMAWSDGASGSYDLLAQNVHANGTLGPAPASLPGDMNCDSLVNLNDVDGFVTALLDPAAYEAAHPCCGVDAADVNADTFVDGADVSGFVSALIDG